MWLLPISLKNIIGLQFDVSLNKVLAEELPWISRIITLQAEIENPVRYPGCR